LALLFLRCLSSLPFSCFSPPFPFFNNLVFHAALARVLSGLSPALPPPPIKGPPPPTVLADDPLQHSRNYREPYFFSVSASSTSSASSQSAARRSRLWQSPGRHGTRHVPRPSPFSRIPLHSFTAVRIHLRSRYEIFPLPSR